MTQKDILDIIGNPKKISQEIREYRENARILSSDQPRIIHKYPKKWIAVYEGKVKADGKTLKSLLSKIDAKRIPKDRTIIRYVDTDSRIVILPSLC